MTIPGDLDLGDELGPLSLTLSNAEVRHFAEVANMPGGRFASDEAAQREGLPGQIVPGNMSLALFSRLLATALPGARLQRVSATFRSLVRPNVELQVRGVVIEKHCTEHGDTIECDLLIETPEGDRLVTGTATLQLPSG
jgi:acyl dehydratase